MTYFFKLQIQCSDMNIQIIYDETELIIHVDANDSDLPALYNRESVC